MNNTEIILANKKKREKQEKKLMKHFNKRKQLKEQKNASKQAWIPADDVAPEILVPGQFF